MSDDLIASLNQRIRELDARNTELTTRATQLRQALSLSQRAEKEAKAKIADIASQAETELDQTAEAVKQLEAERDELRSRAEAAPDEKDARIKELETAARTRDYRDQFREHAGNELAEGVTVEDLWHFAGFDPAQADKLEPQQISELVGKVRETKPILFVKPAPSGNDGTPASGGAQRSGSRPLVLGDSASRGARDTASGRVTYRKTDLHAADWMTKNKPLVEALANGTAECLDG